MWMMMMMWMCSSAWGEHWLLIVEAYATHAYAIACVHHQTTHTTRRDDYFGCVSLRIHTCIWDGGGIHIYMRSLA